MPIDQKEREKELEALRLEQQLLEAENEFKSKLGGGGSSPPLQGGGTPSPVPPSGDASSASLFDLPPDQQREYVRQKMLDFFGLHKSAAEGVGSVAKEVVTDPIGSVAGVGESVLEMGTGLVGAAAGAVGGASAAGTEAIRDEYNNLMEKFGFEDAMVAPGMPEDPGKAYLAVFNDIAEGFTYQPRTEQGQKISEFVGDVFQKFGEWGGDVGTYMLDEGASPAIATAAHTLIAGIPYYVPAILAKGDLRKRGPLVKRAVERGKVIDALEKSGDLEFAGPLDKVITSQKMKPDNVLNLLKQDDILEGYRGESVTKIGFGATEGKGLYLAKNKDLAQFFSETGKVEKITIKKPKNPLVVNEEPLPILHDDFPLYDPIKPSDSKWIKLNKQAAINAKARGVDENNWNPDIVAEELTKLLKKEGYDAVDVTSGGDSWVVVLDPKPVNAFTRSPKQLQQLAAKIQKEGLKEPILMERQADGSLKLVNKGDADKILLAKELRPEEINVRIVEDLQTAKGSEEFTRYIDQNAEKVKKMYEKAEKDLAELEKMKGRTLWSRFKTGAIDASADVKARLLKEGGAAGERAVMRHDLAAGATAEGSRKFQGWEEKIYKDLSAEDVALLDQVIQSRRIIQIDEYKGGEKVKHPGGLTAVEHSQFLTKMQEELGAKRFQKLMEASDKYFEATRSVLVDLYSEGLLTKDQFKAMEGLIYEPRKFINRLDPAAPTLGPKTITVSESGLKELSHGAMKVLETDSRMLLAEYIVRAQNRIARNRANKALYEFAEMYPENGWVKPVEVKNTKSGKVKGKVHIPEGMVRVDTVIDGKVKPMLMESTMAEQWVSANPQISAQMARLLRVASGSVLVRPLATGYNPGFALVNFPRDLVHAYLATSEYSTVPPIFAGQMARDLAAVAKDAWKKQGRFEDFVKEGGGFNFLTHEGTSLFPKRSPTLEAATPEFKGKAAIKWRHAKEAMSKINEFSEIWTRLAIRERALRNGATPEQATWIARDYLDFAQGGKYVKAADHVIPYLNASTQAFRTTARSAVKNPKAFAAKVAWMQSLSAAMYISNYYANRELLEQVPERELLENWIIPTGMSFIDQNGNKRYHYIKVKKDNTLIPFTGGVELLLQRYLLGRVPQDTTLQLLKSSTPVVPTDMLPPTLSAMLTYTTNKDFWLDRDVWRDPDLPVGLVPTEEYNTFPKKPTSPFIKDISQMAGLSPARSEAAVRKVIPRNPFTDLVGTGYALVTEGVDDYTKSQHFLQLLNDAPILRRVSGLTHPAARDIEDINAVVGENAAVRLNKRRKLDELYAKMKLGELPNGETTIRTWIAAQPPDDRQGLLKRLTISKVYDRVIMATRGAQGVPSRIFWVRSANMNPIDRADVYYWKWKAQDEKGRKVMDRLIGRLNSQGVGYRSDLFNKHLARLKRQFGTEYMDGVGEEVKTPKPSRTREKPNFEGFRMK